MEPSNFSMAVAASVASRFESPSSLHLLRYLTSSALYSAAVMMTGRLKVAVKSGKPPQSPALVNKKRSSSSSELMPLCMSISNAARPTKYCAGDKWTGLAHEL